MTTTKTLKQVADFNVAAQTYLKEFPERNKLEYALNKLLPKNFLHFTEFNKEKERVDFQADKIYLKHCATDSKKHIIYDDKGNYIFDKKGAEKSKDEIFALNQSWIPKMEALLEKEVEIENFFVDEEDLPEDLPLTFREAFTDFVIAPKE
jgi:hypothetical protein